MKYNIQFNWICYIYYIQFLWIHSSQICSNILLFFFEILVIGWFIILVMYSLYDSLKEPFDASNMECRFYNAAWEQITTKMEIQFQFFFRRRLPTDAIALFILEKDNFLMDWTARVMDLIRKSFFPPLKYCKNILYTIYK